MCAKSKNLISSYIMSEKFQKELKIFNSYVHNLFSYRYLEEEKRILNLSEVKKKLSKFNYLLESMTNETKKNLTDVAHLRIFYCNLVCLKAMELKLPQWAKSQHLQNDLLDAATTSFDLMSYSGELKRINGGNVLYFIFVDDIQNFKLQIKNNSFVKIILQEHL